MTGTRRHRIVLTYFSTRVALPCAAGSETLLGLGSATGESVRHPQYYEKTSDDCCGEKCDPLRQMSVITEE